MRIKTAQIQRISNNSKYKISNGFKNNNNNNHSNNSKFKMKNTQYKKKI